MQADESILQMMRCNNALEVSEPAWLAQLKDYINELIQHDFDKLVQVLYRVDVSERLLRQTLEAAKGADASGIIAGLLCQRQLQKIKTRREMSQRANDIPEEDRW